MRIAIRGLLIIFILTACSTSLLPSEERPCVPGFLVVGKSPIEAPYGTWLVRFRVALIGCRTSLDTITEAELDLIRSEFREPSEWKPISSYREGRHHEFRALVAQRVNSLLGRAVVTDVFFYSTQVFDHV